MPRGSLRSRADLTVAVAGIAIAAAVTAVYAQVRAFDFVTFDDPNYVSANPHVQQGLSIRGLTWAFTTVHHSFYHPLTWVSHQIDCTLFGLDPGGHHLVNVLLHVANTLILLGLLFRATGSSWRSAAAAAFFGLHPLRVESVAWVAERKDLLCAFFFLLALGAYGRWVRRPSPGRFLVVGALFLSALMAKPMAVTLPFALLLLDLWPLRRIVLGKVSRDARAEDAPARPIAVRTLIVEKVPLFVVAALWSTVTFALQRGGGAVQTLDAFPIGARLANAILAYAAYLRAELWPSNLAFFYPFPAESSVLEVTAALLLLAGISFLVVRAAVRLPYAFAGWLWFLGLLVPVIGIVQSGLQARADRFTYLPSVGLIVTVVWGLADATSRSRLGRRLVLAVAVTSLALFGVLTWRQAATWRDSETLYGHAVRVTRDNAVAHDALGVVLFQRGKLEEAISHHREAVRIRPEFDTAHNNLGVALAESGRLAEAMAHYLRALEIRPDYPEASANLGIALARRGDLEGAITRFQRALDLRPDDGDLHFNMGVALAVRGRTDAALDQFRAAESDYSSVARFAEAAEVAARGRALAEGAGRDGEAGEFARLERAARNRITAP